MAVKRQVVREPGHQRVGDGTLGRQPALDQPGRGDRLGELIRAGKASRLRPDVDQHTKLRRDDVEALGAVLANPVHATAAASAIEAGWLNHTLDARQTRGQMAEVALTRPARRRGGRRGLLLAGLDLGDGRFQAFKGQLPVIIAQLLGPLAMHDMVQLGNEMLQPPVGVLQRVVLLQESQHSGALALGDRGQVDRRRAGHGRIIPRPGCRCSAIQRGESLCHRRTADLQ